MGSPIACLAVHKDTTFTASGSVVTSWRRGKPVLHFTEHTSEVSQMLPFGKHLITVDDANTLKVHHIIVIILGRAVVFFLGGGGRVCNGAS